MIDQKFWKPKPRIGSTPEPGQTYSSALEAIATLLSSTKWKIIYYYRDDCIVIRAIEVCRILIIAISNVIGWNYANAEYVASLQRYQQSYSFIRTD